MLEPIELPKARAGASLIIEETLTNISGMEVPRATKSNSYNNVAYS